MEVTSRPLILCHPIQFPGVSFLSQEGAKRVKKKKMLGMGIRAGGMLIQ